jgi:hypothetical protein
MDKFKRILNLSMPEKFIKQRRINPNASYASIFSSKLITSVHEIEHETLLIIKNADQPSLNNLVSEIEQR